MLDERTHQKIRRRVREITEVAKRGDKASTLFDAFILSLIAANIVVLIVQTVKPIYDLSPTFFETFELLSVLIFTVEYFLRLWSCTASREFSSPLRGRLRFAATPLAVIDLLAILPFYLPFLGVDLRFVRVVRMLRLFRVAKLGRYSRALQTVGRVLKRKREQLIAVLCVLSVLLILSSSLVYFAENRVQPERFSSIPAAMWWAVVTLTTVGYGDMCPMTGLGKAAAALIAVLGIGMFALPAGILGSGFVEEIRQQKPRACPHCGKQLT